MHFLSFILISLFLFFSTCGKKSPNPPVRPNKKGVIKRVSKKVSQTKRVSGTLLKKRVSKKGCQALFYVMHFLSFYSFHLSRGGMHTEAIKSKKKRVSGTLLCIFLFLP